MSLFNPCFAFTPKNHAWQPPGECAPASSLLSLKLPTLVALKIPQRGRIFMPQFHHLPSFEPPHPLC